MNKFKYRISNINQILIYYFPTIDMIYVEAVKMNDYERQLNKSARSGCVEAYEELIRPHR